MCTWVIWASCLFTVSSEHKRKDTWVWHLPTSPPTSIKQRGESEGSHVSFPFNCSEFAATLAKQLASVTAGPHNSNRLSHHTFAMKRCLICHVAVTIIIFAKCNQIAGVGWTSMGIKPHTPHPVCAETVSLYPCFSFLATGHIQHSSPLSFS